MERWGEKKIEKDKKKGGGVNSKQIDLTQFSEQNLASFALPAFVNKNSFSFYADVDLGDFSLFLAADGTATPVAARSLVGSGWRFTPPPVLMSSTGFVTGSSPSTDLTCQRPYWEAVCAAAMLF